MTGYLHASYAASLAEFGEPLRLPRCGGWLLKRQIPEVADFDGMGCYPLFACQRWDMLHSDLEELAGDLVTVAIVADPFGQHSESDLSRCFPDVVRPFKAHFVTDLSRAPASFVDPHHRRYARKALREVAIERCPAPRGLLDDWIGLYTNLIQRHHISGMPAFSKASFLKQLTVPGIVMLRATYEGASVGMTLWYMNGEVAYYHLGAYSDRGYQLHASFALFAFALDYFAACGLRWLSLGGGSGAHAAEADGLTRFKCGWSTGTRTAYFCGRIFDHERYWAIAARRAQARTGYFPAYRTGEFA